MASSIDKDDDYEDLADGNFLLSSILRGRKHSSSLLDLFENQGVDDDDAKKWDKAQTDGHHRGKLIRL